MSKTALSIQMLEILYSRNIVGIAELAKILDTNPRNIPEYKKVLEEAGYVIDTVPGRYGGYVLNKKYTFPSTRLSDTEKEGLMQGFDYLLSRNDFMRKNDYSKAMAKISAATISKEYRDELNETTVIYRYPDSMNEVELSKRYHVMQKCINEKLKLLISYRSNDNIVRQRVVHPYKLYMYNNSWFIIAYCEMAERFLVFKLIRMLEYEILDEKFRRSLLYNERDYLDEYGMKNGDWFEVKLKFTGKHAMFVDEYRYGKNQIVERVDDDTTIISVTMQYRDDIVGFVLSHQEFCEVLEPEWLKEEVFKASKKIAEKYVK